MNNLIKSTGIHFIQYNMSINDLKNNIAYTRSLTQNDKIKLTKMLLDQDFIEFKEVIQYMLENNIKLEQEVFD